MRLLLPLLISLLTLSNALASEVVFEKDTSLPLVYLRVAVRVGSIHDPDALSGLTHLTAQTLLRGTTSRSKDQIDLQLDRLGSALGVEVRSEYLVFSGAVLSANLTSFLDLLTEILTQPSFPVQEVRKLKKEIISQILDSYGDDRTIAQWHFKKALFGNHPYGKLTLGTRQSVSKFTINDLTQHYHSYFTSNRILIVGTGDADQEIIQTWASQLDDLLPKGEDIHPIPSPPPIAHKKIVIVDKPDRTQTQIFGGQIGVPMGSEDFFPLFVGNQSFGGSFTSRFMNEIRVKKGWSYGAYTFFQYASQPHSWIFWLFPANKDTPDALSTSLRLLEELQNNGLTPEEFQFTRTSLINSDGFRFNTPQKRVENALTEKLLGLSPGFMSTYRKNLQALSLDSVNAALKKFLQTQNQVIVILGTAKELVPHLSKKLGIPVQEIQVVPYDQF